MSPWKGTMGPGASHRVALAVERRPVRPGRQKGDGRPYVVTMISDDPEPGWFLVEVGPNEGPIHIGAAADIIDNGDRSVVSCSDHALVGDLILNPHPSRRWEP